MTNLRAQLQTTLGDAYTLERELGGVFRILVGLYRVLYSVEGRRLIVTILKIGHRQDVYR